MALEELFCQLSLWMVNLCLKSSNFCLYFIQYRYLHVWIRILKAPEYGYNTDPDTQHWTNNCIHTSQFKCWLGSYGEDEGETDPEGSVQVRPGPDVVLQERPGGDTQKIWTNYQSVISELVIFRGVIRLQIFESPSAPEPTQQFFRH